MNHAFVDLLAAFHHRQIKLILDKGLSSVADAGFVQVDGCFVLATAANNSTNATQNDFADQTGYECFLNHIHVDDYVSRDRELQTLAFCAAVLGQWNDRLSSASLNSIVAINDQGATARFHVLRANESWLADDLESYTEAVMEISSADTAFFELFGLGA